MSKKLKPLKALKELKKRYGKNFSIQDDNRMKIVETALKALEIIKKKRVDVLELSVCANYETYLSFFKRWNFHGEYDNFILTQEEYDLLKEVLL